MCILALDIQSTCIEYGLPKLFNAAEDSSIGPRGTACLLWKWDRTWLLPCDDIKVLSHILQPKCAEYKPQTLLAPRDEIRVLALDMQFIRTEYGLQKWLATTQEIRSLTFVLEPICAEYGLRTWLAQTEGISPIDLRDTGYLCWI